MAEKSDRKELEPRLQQAKRAVALLNDPITTERLQKLVKDLEKQLREAD
jgi:predicted GTPase